MCGVESDYLTTLCSTTDCQRLWHIMPKYRPIYRPSHRVPHRQPTDNAGALLPTIYTGMAINHWRWKKLACAAYTTNCIIMSLTAICVIGCLHDPANVQQTSSWLGHYLRLRRSASLSGWPAISVGESKIWPPVFPKPLNFSEPKFAQMITSGISWYANFGENPLTGGFPMNRWNITLAWLFVLFLPFFSCPLQEKRLNWF